MAPTTKINPKALASDWIIKAMASANLNVNELAQRSGVSRPTIYKIIQHKQKDGCRLDMLILLVHSCGLTFREFESVVKPL